MNECDGHDRVGNCLAAGLIGLLVAIAITTSFMTWDTFFNANHQYRCTAGTYPSGIDSRGREEGPCVRPINEKGIDK